MNVTIETPNHAQVIQYIQNIAATPMQLEQIVQLMAQEALRSMREDLASHSRSGATIESLETWPVTNTATSYALAVGTQTRGRQLRWLDKGRGEVRPIHLTKTGKMGFLRWLSWPSHAIVFARYARATAGLNIMQKAGALAMVQSGAIVAKTLANRQR